jgi:hypothetical protein
MERVTAYLFLLEHEDLRNMKSYYYTNTETITH